MRILIVTPYAPPHIGGLETVVDIEIRGLIAMGHEVKVVAANIGLPGHKLPRHDMLYGARISRLPILNFLEEKFGIRWPVFGPSVIAEIWRSTRWADAVHIHGHMFIHTPFAFFAAKRFKKTAVLSMHGILGIWCTSRLMRTAQHFLLHSLGRFSFVMADAITLQNPAHQKLLEGLGAKHSRTHVLFNPVEKTAFRPPTKDERAQARIKIGWSNDRKKVLFVGKINEGKGCDLLLQVTDDTYDIVLCGDRSGSLCKKIPDHITVLPPRSRQEMLPLYHAADLLVLPSRAECQPMVICEALLCGLPAVVGRYEGADDLLNYRHIYLADHTVDSLKSAIKTALAEHENQAASLEKPLLTDDLPAEKEWVEKIVELLGQP